MKNSLDKYYGMLQNAVYEMKTVEKYVNPQIQIVKANKVIEMAEQYENQAQIEVNNAKNEVMQAEANYNSATKTNVRSALMVVKANAIKHRKGRLLGKQRLFKQIIDRTTEYKKQAQQVINLAYKNIPLIE